MRKQNEQRKQSNQYDKIIKENLEVTIPVIIREIFELDIKLSEELPDEVQHTKERKPDALKKVTDNLGNSYVLQVEFQLEDEKEMVYRMAEYNVMLMRKYRLPIKQYVIFLKDKNPLMPTFINTENLKYNYALIKIAEIDYKVFLTSNNPEVKILGILANFGNDDHYEAVKSIIKGIQSITKEDFAESRHFKQLRIFVQLRSSIKQVFKEVMITVSKFFKEENDFLFVRGEAKGEEKKSHTVVQNLILKLGFTDEQAADVAEVDIAYVKKVRLQLHQQHR